MPRLDAQVAFVTGAARGIGRAIARRLAEDGADVIATDVRLTDDGDMRETVAQVEASGRRCVELEADVRDQRSLDRAIRDGVAALGRLDIVCANAGIGGFGRFWELSEDQWSTVVDVNLGGAWRTAKAAAPRLIEQRSGAIVLTASINGREAIADAAHYVAAKHGVLGLAKALALELGRYGIRVNSVLPGLIHTRMGDNEENRRRLGGGVDGGTEAYLEASRGWQLLAGRSALPPTAVADAVAWLASDQASEVTGHELVVDAGHSVLPGVNQDPPAAR
jgi:NAD(P)-dependent dehydrogenase (short-subunit alcohol dehydrogenase family)